MPAQLKASPRNPMLGALADKLTRLKELANKYEVLNRVPLVGGKALGDLVLGQGPEEISNWSYGNAPMQIPQMTRIPQMKKGRAESVADTLFMAADIGGLGALAGALGSRGLRNLVSSGSRVGSKGLNPQVGAIKPKGGNWYMDLKGVQTSQNREFEGYKVTGDDEKALALNNWVETALKKYAKNDMGTPQDPVRILADRGILHREFTTPRGFNKQVLKERRKAEGFPEEGLAESDLGKQWEDLTDSVIEPQDVKKLAEWTISDNPWLVKEGSNPRVYGLHPHKLHDRLGFKHLMDELANATNPESGLPRELLLKYDALPRVTVPQAVERVAKINNWRAQQKVLADQAKATNPATQVFKEYPDKGYKWVELRPNPELDPDHKALAEALKYEGDTMGHCVGGYCNDVASGQSRIYSLRDAKGQPHTTIEVAPEVGDPISNRFRELDQETIDEIRAAAMARDIRNIDWGSPGRILPEDEASLRRNFIREETLKRFPEWADLKPGQRIVQIKGKANRPPKDEYLPFIRDFVQSGQWSSVDELENAGLIMRDGQFVIPDPEPEGFAQGGLVRSYNPEEIDQIIAQLVG